MRDIRVPELTQVALKDDSGTIIPLLPFFHVDSKTTPYMGLVLGVVQTLADARREYFSILSEGVRKQVVGLGLAARSAASFRTPERPLLQNAVEVHVVQNLILHQTIFENTLITKPELNLALCFFWSV